jgi:hypothetical protein
MTVHWLMKVSRKLSNGGFAILSKIVAVAENMARTTSHSDLRTLKGGLPSPSICIGEDLLWPTCRWMTPTSFRPGC